MNNELQNELNAIKANCFDKMMELLIQANIDIAEVVKGEFTLEPNKEVEEQVEEPKEESTIEIPANIQRFFTHSGRFRRGFFVGISENLFRCFGNESFTRDDIIPTILKFDPDKLDALGWYRKHMLVSKHKASFVGFIIKYLLNAKHSICVRRGVYIYNTGNVIHVKQHRRKINKKVKIYKTVNCNVNANPVVENNNNVSSSSAVNTSPTTVINNNNFVFSNSKKKA